MAGPFKMKGNPMQRNFGIGVSPATQKREGKTRLTDKITAAINAPFTPRATYKELKGAYRKARAQGQDPADLDRDQLRAHLKGEKARDQEDLQGFIGVHR